MIKLADIYLSDEVKTILTDKTKIYNNLHPEEPLTIQQMAETLLEYGVRYLDVTALN